MSMPKFSRQLTNAIDNYETMLGYWHRCKEDPTSRWSDLHNVGKEVALRRKQLVLAIKAEFRTYQHEVPTTVECLVWYEHRVMDRHPLTRKAE